MDVREPQEFEAGHLPEAINIPYSQIEKRAAEIEKDHPYIFYCISSSWRAPYSANTLADLGYTNVYVLEGGINAWNAGGQVLYASQKSIPPMVALYPKGLTKELYHPADQQYLKKIQITSEELAQYDGKNGRPAYVAIDSIIYDVTQSRLWRGGEHDPSHGKATAGRDLTEIIKDAPHGREHLEKFPVVGSLKQ